MAILNALSGSAIAQAMQVNVNILGGIRYNEFNGSESGLPIAAGAPADAKTELSSAFGRTDTIIEALNHLKAASTGLAPAGVSGSIQLKEGGEFNDVVGLTSTLTLVSVPAALTAAGAITAGTLTDSTLSINAGSISGGVGAGFSGTVSAGTLTDGTLSSNAGSISGGVGAGFSGVVSAGTLTDGTLSANAGSISGGVAASFSGLGDFGSLTATTSVVGASLSDGVATLTAGSISGGVAASFSGLGDFGSLTATTSVVGASLSDGVATLTAGSISAGVAATFSGAIQGGTLESDDTLDVAGISTLAADVKIWDSSKDGNANPTQAVFNALPKLQIQGTTQAGVVDNFELYVSGGLLRAVAV